MIGIINYGMGNVGSVFNVIDYLGYDIEVAQPDVDFMKYSHLILPGVGSYAQAMQNLVNFGLDHKIREFIRSGRPFLGICLGMQLLSTFGEEGGQTKGLNMIPGKVKLMNPGKQHRLPHVGWNNLQVIQEHPILKEIKSEVDFYFVHSFHFEPDLEENSIGKTDYGEYFVSAVASNNIVGVQFHPEKSQKNGIKVVENFCCWSGVC